MPKTYEPIATQTLGSAAASVTFSSITGTYTDLRLIIVGGFAGGLDDLLVRVNGDSGTNYSRTFLYGSGSAAVSGRQSNTNGYYIAGLNGGQSVSKWDFMNYSNTTTNKTVLVRSDAADWATFATVGLWRNTAAITSMSIANGSAGNFNSGTSFTLYGIKAA
jgi:hypothetical protein